MTEDVKTLQENIIYLEEKLDDLNYDYKQEVKHACEDRIMELFHERRLPDIHDKDDLYNALWDDFEESDCITGAASGSYTFNRWKAGMHLAYNWWVINDMIEDGEIDLETLKEPEYVDVRARCYLLPQALDAAIEEADLPEEWWWDEYEWEDHDTTKEYLANHPDLQFVGHEWNIKS